MIYLKSHITKQLLTSISVDIWIYLPSKVIFTSASGLGQYHFFQVDKSFYHIFTVKYILFTYAIQAQVLCTYRDTISRKLYQFKICQNPYLPRETWTHITPPYHTPNLESCISSKFVKIHISLGRYGLISHPHITPQTSYHISRDPHIRSALFYSIVRCKLFSIYKSNFCI